MACSLRALLIVFASLQIQSARAQNRPSAGFPPIEDFQKLATQAPVVVAGTISSLEPLGQGDDLHTNIKLSIAGFLKGRPVHPPQTIVLSRQATGPFANLHAGEFGIFFLRGRDDGHVDFEDPNLPRALASPAGWEMPGSDISISDNDMYRIARAITSTLTLPLITAGDPKAGVATDLFLVGDFTTDYDGTRREWIHRPSITDRAEETYEEAARELAFFPKSVKIAALHDALMRPINVSASLFVKGLLLESGDLAYLKDVEQSILAGSHGDVNLTNKLVRRLENSSVGKEGFTLLLPLLHAPTPDVRMAAISAVNAGHSPTSVEPLMELLSDPVQAVKLDAINTVCGIIGGCAGAATDFLGPTGNEHLRQKVEAWRIDSQ